VAALRSWTVSGTGDMEGAPGVELVTDPAAAVKLALQAAPEAP